MNPPKPFWVTLLALSLPLAMSAGAWAKKGGKPLPDEVVTYTASLSSMNSSGEEVFAPVTLDKLTADGRGTVLSADEDLLMAQLYPVEILDDQGGSMGQHYVFNFHCPELVGSGPVGFKAVAGNWSINYIRQKRGPGHIYIVMRNLLVDSPPLLNVYDNPDFDFDLHGDADKHVAFLPTAEGVPSVFYLTEYKLWAGVAGQGGFVCNSDGRPGLNPTIKLVITRDFP
jgi:hypothetical protein